MFTISKFLEFHWGDGESFLIDIHTYSPTIGRVTGWCGIDQREPLNFIPGRTDSAIS